ncbi:aldo/keto reductase [Rhodocytophaga rosea]|uniref:Aldo/keto reductase n=1 Tax=Rhodocytophaga rosea TaxID=2704465 RepID=A0A6C0GLX7_9BACT|nr:aldo/keto reductase [Rhodocytophaga rosea]QHT69038.1 aldo/keto reductase [Rhodocytophaga rosea]
MNYRLLGKSGLRVSELCLGTMTFGEEWGWGANKEESRKIFDAFAEAGGNFLDTANFYTKGTSEKMVGEFIQADRERFVVATKYTLYNKHGDVNASGNHRKNLVQSIEASLKRLNVDFIDLMYLHMWDSTTPVEEVMRGLDDLVRAGKILYIAISDAPAWIVSQANTLADLRGWTQFIGLQIEYSLIQRTPERDLLPMAKAFNIGVTAWAPLAGGALSGKYLDANDDPKRLKENSSRLNERNTAIARVVKEMADDMGWSPSQVAINWVRQQAGGIIPIVGARNEKQIKDSLGALKFTLSEERLNKLNEVSKIELGFPHDFLLSDGVKENAYGGMYDRIIR